MVAAPTRCPKCSGFWIDGPRYRKPDIGTMFGTPFAGETLVFTCRTCGYEMTRPTDDFSPTTSEGET